ncbi:MAG: hypothetical protein P8L79_04250 [Rhodospirillaceae bacterium]|nr:hypothetical protein [Rhodospirillaceae bacterium]
MPAQVVAKTYAVALRFDSVRYFVITERVTGYQAPFGIIRFHELGLAD